MNIIKVHIMQKEIDPLDLKSLPPVPPPEDGWPAVRNGLEKHFRRRRAVRFGGIALAAAASISLAVGLFLTQPAPGPGPLPGAGTETADTRPQPENSVQPVDSLIALSQQLESRLRVTRNEVGNLPTETLIYQVELEDTIAMVDDQLSMNPASRELWSQRVNLLLDLDELYRNQLRREYLQMASL